MSKQRDKQIEEAVDIKTVAFEILCLNIEDSLSLTKWDWERLAKIDAILTKLIKGQQAEGGE